MPVLNQFDRVNNIVLPSDSHCRADSTKDCQMIVEDLLSAKVFSMITERRHTRFPRPRNVLHGREHKTLLDWIKKKLKTFYSAR